MPKILENRLIEEFKGKDSFSREDLFDFYRYYEPGLKEGTFGWRIYDLKNKNVIRPIKKGHYVVSQKPIYKAHQISQELIKLAKKLTELFGDAKYCIWESKWLNEFAKLQASKSIIIIEIEKDFVESVYYELKDASISELFLNPDAKTLDFYIAESAYPVIIKKLITRSPVASRTEKKVEFNVPLLEKILVDLFAEEKLFYHLRGSELIHIYENAISSYAVNFTKLFSYARRRDRESQIKQFMINHIDHLVKDIIE